MRIALLRSREEQAYQAIPEALAKARPLAGTSQVVEQVDAWDGSCRGR